MEMPDGGRLWSLLGSAVSALQAYGGTDGYTCPSASDVVSPGALGYVEDRRGSYVLVTDGQTIVQQRSQRRSIL